MLETIQNLKAEHEIEKENIHTDWAGKTKSVRDEMEARKRSLP